MRVVASELEELATTALMARGVSKSTATTMAHEAVIAEISGKKTHGVGKLLSLNLGDLSATPTVNRMGSLIIVNGNGGNGYATMRQVATIATQVTADLGVAVAVAR